MFPGFVLVDLYFIFIKMNSFVIYILFVIFVAVLLLTLNFLLSSHNPYMEKKTAFECGFHSFLGQNRTQFTISFFIFALLFLLFDLEILLIYPYTVSAYNNSAYGLLIMLIFFLLLTGGLVFELGKKALTIYSKQKQNFFII
jgi:NADH-ubiquinone oxidoreductase chain 3